MAWQVKVRRGAAWLRVDKERREKAGAVRSRKAWQGRASNGLVRQGGHGVAWRGYYFSN